MKDFYYILGTDANCSFDEIKEAYRKLSKKFHPDLNQGDFYFESRFKEIQEAYETLIDPSRRLVYDAALKKSRSNQSQDENYANQSYSGRQKTTGSNYQRKASSFGKPGRRIGAGMTIVLIITVVIIGAYSIEYLTHSKKTVVNHALTYRAVVLKSHKHHKRKHSLKNKADPVFSKPDSDMKVNNTAKVVPVMPPVIKPVPSVNKPAPVKFVQVNNKTTGNNGNYLYATYVIPNATKVINMRESNLYTSNVIEKIPANSKVFVLEKGDAYYKVMFNNSTGYVPKWCLQDK